MTFSGQCIIQDTRVNADGVDEYYVHFISCKFTTSSELNFVVNKRLDEWVTADRFVGGEIPADSSEAKNKRNRGRKDEGGGKVKSD